MPRHPDCAALQVRADAVLAGGPGTFSKASSRYAEGLAPYALVRGEGAYVWGTNGQRYLDTVAALGAVLCGHAHPSITQAVIDQAWRGASLSMLHPLEVEVGEQLCAMLPGVEMVRFAKSGTDAVQMAVRLARAVTGHKHTVFLGYHGGGGDSYAITTDKSAGVLAQLAPYNHQVTWSTLDAVSPKAWEDLACIVTEVPALLWRTDPASYRWFLNRLQSLATIHGGLFVLDEIVTFPRWGTTGSAAEHYGITPDLTCVSKGIANGYPLAALCGKRAVMERFNAGDIFASWTFAGETTALAAARETLRLIETTDALITLDFHGTVLGTTLMHLLEEAHLPATLYGHPARLSVRWEDTPQASAAALRTLWLAELARLGVLWGIGVAFPMTCWDGTVMRHLLSSVEEACTTVAKALADDQVQERLPCPVITDVLSVRP